MTTAALPTSGPTSMTTPRPAPASPPEPTAAQENPRRWFALGILAAGLAMIVLDGTIVGVALLLVRDAPILSLIGLTLFGFGCAPVYPGLMHETPRRFDAVMARKVIGWQVAAAGTGAAVMPAVFGVIAARLGMEAVFPLIFVIAVVLLVLCIRLDKMTPTAGASKAS